MKPKALFIAPPARVPVMRDYYCTSVAKAGYAWHPAEFLVQSGFFAGDWDVVILDAVAENLSEYAALARVTREPADVVFGLVGAADPNADLDFLRRVPARFKAVSGEVVQPDAAAFLSRTPGFDAAVSDFSTPGLLTAAHGEREAEGVAIRHGDEIAPALPTRERVFRIPRPRHELFRWTSYRMPLQRHRPFASFLSDYGCPYDCAFCNTGRLRYRTRPADELRDELATLAEMGFRELFVKDMSFGAHKRHADETLALLAERHFSWHTYARLEDLPPAVLARMAETGAHLVQVGLEHVVPEILGPMGKPYGVRDIEEFFAASRDARIDVGLHLVLGLPGETPATLAALEDFLAREADPAYVSINLYAPRKGARLAQAEGGGDDPHDSTRGSDSGALPRDVLRRARDRMYRRFYARPARVRRLAGQMRLPEMWHGVRRVFAG